VSAIGNAFFDQRQALWHTQGFGAMRGRTIQDQHDTLAGGDVRACELIEKRLID
jgi:hypothetical protein